MRPPWNVRPSTPMSRSCLTVANTAATTVDDACLGQTALEYWPTHRPQRTVLDGLPTTTDQQVWSCVAVDVLQDAWPLRPEANARCDVPLLLLCLTCLVRPTPRAAHVSRIAFRTSLGMENLFRLPSRRKSW
jgi:hypothetical protein